MTNSRVRKFCFFLVAVFASSLISCGGSGGSSNNKSNSNTSSSSSQLTITGTALITAKDASLVQSSSAQSASFLQMASEKLVQDESILSSVESEAISGQVAVPDGSKVGIFLINKNAASSSDEDALEELLLATGETQDGTIEVDTDSIIDTTVEKLSKTKLNWIKIYVGNSGFNGAGDPTKFEVNRVDVLSYSESTKQFSLKDTIINPVTTEIAETVVSEIVKDAIEQEDSQDNSALDSTTAKVLINAVIKAINKVIASKPLESIVVQTSTPETISYGGSTKKEVVVNTSAATELGLDQVQDDDYLKYSQTKAIIDAYTKLTSALATSSTKTDDEKMAIATTYLNLAMKRQVPDDFQGPLAKFLVTDDGNSTVTDLARAYHAGIHFPGNESLALSVAKSKFQEYQSHVARTLATGEQLDEIDQIFGKSIGSIAVADIATTKLNRAKLMLLFRDAYLNELSGNDGPEFDGAAFLEGLGVINLADTPFVSSEIRVSRVFAPGSLYSQGSSFGDGLPVVEIRVEVRATDNATIDKVELTIGENTKELNGSQNNQFDKTKQFKSNPSEDIWNLFDPNTSNPIKQTDESGFDSALSASQQSGGYSQDAFYKEYYKNSNDPINDFYTLIRDNYFVLSQSGKLTANITITYTQDNEEKTVVLTKNLYNYKLPRITLYPSTKDFKKEFGNENFSAYRVESQKDTVSNLSLSWSKPALSLDTGLTLKYRLDLNVSGPSSALNKLEEVGVEFVEENNDNNNQGGDYFFKRIQLSPYTRDGELVTERTSMSLLSTLPVDEQLRYNLNIQPVIYKGTEEVNWGNPTNMGFHIQEADPWAASIFGTIKFSEDALQNKTGGTWKVGIFKMDGPNNFNNYDRPTITPVSFNSGNLIETIQPSNQNLEVEYEFGPFSNENTAFELSSGYEVFIWYDKTGDNENKLTRFGSSNEFNVSIGRISYYGRVPEVNTYETGAFYPLNFNSPSTSNIPIDFHFGFMPGTGNGDSSNTEKDVLFFDGYEIGIFEDIPVNMTDTFFSMSSDNLFVQGKVVTLPEQQETLSTSDVVDLLNDYSEKLDLLTEDITESDLERVTLDTPRKLNSETGDNTIKAYKRTVQDGSVEDYFDQTTATGAFTQYIIPLRYNKTRVSGTTVFTWRLLVITIKSNNIESTLETLMNGFFPQDKIFSNITDVNLGDQQNSGSNNQGDNGSNNQDGDESLFRNPQGLTQMEFEFLNGLDILVNPEDTIVPKDPSMISKIENLLALSSNVSFGPDSFNHAFSVFDSSVGELTLSLSDTLQMAVYHVDGTRYTESDIETLRSTYPINQPFEIAISMPTIQMNMPTVSGLKIVDAENDQLHYIFFYPDLEQLDSETFHPGTFVDLVFFGNTEGTVSNEGGSIAISGEPLLQNLVFADEENHNFLSFDADTLVYNEGIDVPAALKSAEIDGWVFGTSINDALETNFSGIGWNELLNISSSERVTGTFRRLENPTQDDLSAFANVAGEEAAFIEDLRNKNEELIGKLGIFPLQRSTANGITTVRFGYIQYNTSDNPVAVMEWILAINPANSGEKEVSDLIYNLGESPNNSGTSNNNQNNNGGDEGPQIDPNDIPNVFVKPNSNTRPSLDEIRSTIQVEMPDIITSVEHANRLSVDQAAEAVNSINEKFVNDQVGDIISGKLIKLFTDINLSSQDKYDLFIEVLGDLNINVNNG